MHYPASATIAAKWPLWHGTIEQCDHFLHENAGKLLRVDAIAEFVDQSDSTVRQILDEYTKHAVTEPIDARSCPIHANVLFDPSEPRISMRCDRCNKVYLPEQLIAAASVIVARNDSTACNVPPIPVPIGAGEFHVFLSHNSHDKESIRTLKILLEDRGIKCWHDEDELRPGMPWQRLLEEGIRKSKSVVVAVADSGLGPWEEEEMNAALLLAVRKKIPVIPILLPETNSAPALPMFLYNRTWVDLRGGYTPEGIDRLIWGITGIKRGDDDGPASEPLELVRGLHGGRFGRKPIKGWVAGIMLCAIAIMLAAILSISFWDVEPTYVTCRIYDEKTHDPIEKDFTVVNRRGESTACGLRLGFQVQASFLDPIDRVQIKCGGYKDAPKLDCEVNIVDERVVDQHVRRFCLERADLNYVKSIKPDAPAWPGHDELRQVELDHQPLNGPVTVFVRNDTNYHPDLLFYPFRDTDPTPNPKNREPATIAGSELKETTGGMLRNTYLGSDTEKLGFAVYISFFGRKAERIPGEHGSLYFDSPFQLIRIFSDRPPYAEVIPRTRDPRDNP